jgi:NADPH:quinone reductase
LANKTGQKYAIPANIVVEIKQQRMKAIVFDAIGDPESVLELRDLPIPEPGDNEVLVKMVSASINPGDFLFVQNLYPEPKKPKFPAQIAGNHGAGIIELTGKNVSLAAGTLVAFSYYNTWAEYAVVPAGYLIPLPEDYPVEKSGQLINPISAWDLLDRVKVSEGQWLALTAGYSTVSRMIAQFARLRGIRVISIVRKRHPGLEIGSPLIELEGLQGSIREKIMEITGNRGINGLIDHVGGPLMGELIRSTAFGATVVISGGMSAEQFSLHNFDVLMNGLEIRSYVYRYLFSPLAPGDERLLEEIIRITHSPDFLAPVGGYYPLEDFKTAISATIHTPGGGKHLFVMSR